METVVFTYKTYRADFDRERFTSLPEMGDEIYIDKLSYKTLQVKKIRWYIYDKFTEIMFYLDE